MAASRDQAAVVALADALRKRERKEVAEAEFADAYLRYLRDGRDAGWSWTRIGEGLGMTGRGCELYWKRNKMRAGRLGDAPAS